MLVVVAVTGLDEGKAGQGVVCKVSVVGGQRRDVGRIDAERISSIANCAGRLGGSGTRGTGRILIHEPVRIRHVGEVGGGVRGIWAAGAGGASEAEALGGG